MHNNTKSISDLAMNSNSPSQSVSVKNRSQAIKRGTAGLRSSIEKLIDLANVPLIAIYLHPESDQCNLIADSASYEALGKTDVINVIESILYKSHKAGQKLVVFDRKHQRDIARNTGDELASENTCHLPKPVLKLHSERAFYNFESTRDLLASVLAAEGFGRGGNELRYRVAENQPKWWDGQFESTMYWVGMD